jgi:hypothetical protein
MQARQGIAGMLEGPVCDSAESSSMQEHVSVLAVRLWRMGGKKKRQRCEKTDRENGTTNMA